MNKEGVISIAQFRTDTAPPHLANSKVALKNILPIKSNDELRVIKTSRDSGNYTYQTYNQYYKGIRVEDGIYHVSAKEDVLQSAIGNFHPVGEVNVMPQISEEQALQYAIDYIGAEMYAWLDPYEEAKAHEHWGISYYPQGELVIVKDHLKTDTVYRLAYMFDILATQPLSHDLVYVDAISGEVIYVSTLISNCHNTTGTAETYYNYGTKQITADRFLDAGVYKYRLREWRNGLLETYDEFGNDFIDGDNYWTYSEHGNSIVGLDVHWAAEKTLDYFAQKHQRYGWNGSGNTKLVCKVHTSFGLDDAYWVGTYAEFGFGRLNNPYVTLDAVAHEIGHAVTQSTMYLKGTGVTGSINEGISDIWAACIEYWVTGNITNAWYIAEDIPYNRPAIRCMSNPKSLGHPDTYMGTNWAGESSTNSTIVHTNCGIIDYWFYLLSQGGSGTNDLGNSYNVTGIGIENAAKIMYKILTNNPSTSQRDISFEQFKAFSITAANALLNSSSSGLPSHSLYSVMAAWYAVGLTTSLPYSITYSGNAVICNNENRTFTADLPSNVPASLVTWSCSSNMQIVSGSGNSRVIRATGNGTAWVKVFVSGMLMAQKIDILVGPPNVSASTIVVSCAVNQTQTISPPSTSGVTTYRWLWTYNPSGSSTSLNNYVGNSVNVVIHSASAGNTLFAFGRNSCGESTGPTYVYVFNVGSISIGGYSTPNTGFTAYPNPAGSSLSIAIDANERDAYYAALQQEQSLLQAEVESSQAVVPLQEADEDLSAALRSARNDNLGRLSPSGQLPNPTPTYDIRLYDGYGTLLRQTSSAGQTVVFDIASLPSGLYYLHIYDGIADAPAMQTIMKE